MIAELPAGASENPKVPTVTRSQRILARLLGALLAFTLLAIALLVYWRSQAIPALKVVEYESAQDLWESKAPANYLIETQVAGNQPATYRVHVQNHQVMAAFRNNNPLKDLRTLGTWSVPGMFGTMQRDVDANQQAEAEEPLHLRVEFDPQFGYPAKYVRLKWGTKVTTSWEVTRFEIDPPAWEGADL